MYSVSELQMCTRSRTYMGDINLIIGVIMVFQGGETPLKLQKILLHSESTFDLDCNCPFLKI